MTKNRSPEVETAAELKPALLKKAREGRQTQRAFSLCERHSSGRRNDLLPRLAVDYVQVESLQPARRRIR